MRAAVFWLLVWTVATLPATLTVFQELYGLFFLPGLPFTIMLRIFFSQTHA